MQVIEIISHKSIKIVLKETFLMDLEIYFALLIHRIQYQES